MTFKKTLSSDAFSTVYSVKLPRLERVVKSSASENPPSGVIGTSKRVATSSAMRDPGINDIKERAVITSSLVRQVKWTSYIAYRADSDSVVPTA